MKHLPSREVQPRRFIRLSDQNVCAALSWVALPIGRHLVVAFVALFAALCHAENWLSVGDVAKQGIQIDLASIEVRSDGIKVTWMAYSIASSATEYVSILNCRDFNLRQVEMTPIYPTLVGQYRRGKSESFDDPVIRKLLTKSGYLYPSWGAREGNLLRVVCAERVEGWTELMRDLVRPPRTCPDVGAKWLSVYYCSTIPNVVENFALLMLRAVQMEKRCGIASDDVLSGISVKLRQVETTCRNCTAQLLASANDTLASDLADATTGTPCNAFADMVETAKRAEAEESARQEAIASRGAAYLRCARAAVATLDDNASQPSEIAAVAHQKCRIALRSKDDVDVFSPAFLSALEASLLQRLPELVLEFRAALRQREDDGRTSQPKAAPQTKPSAKAPARVDRATPTK